MNEQSKLMTIAEVAKYFQCSIRTVRKWVFEGKIKHTKLIGLVRFKKEDVEKWVNEKAVQAKK